MRTELERRPLVLLAVGLIVGLVLLRHPLAASALLGLLLLVRSWRHVAWILSGLAVGLALAPTPVPPMTSREYVECSATVITTPKIHADHQSVHIQAGDRRFVMRSPLDEELARGDRINVVGVVKPPSEASQRYLAMKGVQGRLDPIRLERVRTGPWPYVAAESLRRRFLAFTASVLPPATAGAVDALCFNVDTLLDEETRTDLQRTGTVHIVSASGLHAMVLASSLLFLLALLPIPRGWQILLVALILGFYACATGLHGPMVRAGLVACAGLCAYLFRRDPDALSALALAAVGYLLWQPREVYQIGFQLSFVIVAAFAMFLPHGGDGSPWATIKAWFVASLVASVAATPIVAYHFGTVPLLTIPANALIAFVVPPIVVLSLAGFGLSFLWPALAQGLLFAVSPLVAWLYSVVERLSQPSWSVLQVPEFSGYWLLPIYGAALLTWRRREVKASA